MLANTDRITIVCPAVRPENEYCSALKFNSASVSFWAIPTAPFFHGPESYTALKRSSSPRSTKTVSLTSPTVSYP